MESINHESKNGSAYEMAELWLLKQFNIEKSTEIFIDPKQYNYYTIRAALENLNYTCSLFLMEWKPDKTIFCNKKQLQKFIQIHNIGYTNYQSGLLFKIDCVGEKIKNILMINISRQIKKGFFVDKKYYMISFSQGRIVQ
jgi:hypothetical protein